MDISRTLRRLVPLFAVAIATPAIAGDRPFHVAVSAGRTDIGDIDSIAVDDSATAFSLATGYRFVDWLGIEAAYVNVGTVRSTVEIPAATQLKATADGFEVTMVARLPMGDAWAARARAGVFWWNSDASLGDESSNTNGNDLTWGLGVEYAFGPAFSVTADWTRHVVNDVDADTIWLGVMLHFGDVDSPRR